MIELVLSICLIAEPTRCRDVRLSFAEPSVTPQSCLMNGQIEIAKWIDSHPTGRSQSGPVRGRASTPRPDTVLDFVCYRGRTSGSVQVS